MARGPAGPAGRGPLRGPRPAGPRRFDRNGPRPAGDAALGRTRPTDALQLPPKAMRVLIAGGGTGGHVVPALAIAEALQRRNAESKVLLVGSNRGIEAEIVPKAGFELVELGVRALPRHPSPQFFPAAWSLTRALFRMIEIIRAHDAQVVVGTGGYVSFAAIVAAKLLRRKTLLQEQNSVPGRANRFLSRWADEVHIHFTEARRHFRDRGKLRLSGNPVRVRIAEGRALKTLQKYRLFPDRRTVLILGGSQGAHSINEAFGALLPHFRGDRGVQFVIQTGKADYKAVLDGVANSGCRVVVKSFISGLDEFYSVADLVVARAGAMTLAELCAFGLPSILVPYPHAADDHQTTNARAMADKEAAILLADRDLSGDRLAEEIRRLLDDDLRLRKMGMNAYGLSRPDAARHIAEAVEKLAGAAPQSLLHLPEEFEEQMEAAKEAK